MRRAAILAALLFACSKAPGQGSEAGHGGAGTVVTGSGGQGGKPPSDAALLDLVEQADADPDCGIPNGGIGICLDPAKDCPPETECWSWECAFGMCSAVPKS